MPEAAVGRVAGSEPNTFPEIEAQYRGLLAAMSEGALLLGANGRILVMNRAAERILGSTAADLPDHGSEFPWAVLRSDETALAPDEQPWMVTLRTGQPQADVVIGIARSDDNPLWVCANVEPLFNPGESTCCAVVTVFRDVTPRPLVEDLLLRREANLNSLFEAIPNPFFIKDRKGRYLGFNSVFENFLGLSREQLLGKTVYDISPKQLADRYYEADQALFDHPGTQIYESKVSWPDGSLRDVMFHKATFAGADGEVRGLTGTIVDVTRHKQIEDALRQRERQYRTLVEHSPDLIVRYDAQLSRIYVNPAWEKASGFSADEVVNVPVEQLPKVPQPIAGEYLAVLKEVVANGTRRTVDFSWVNARGETLHLQYVVVPERDQDGNVASLLAVGRDITEYKRSEDALRDHEIHLQRVNRALRAISAGNEVLVRAESEQELLEQTCRVIVQEGGHLLSSIDYSEPDSETLRPRAWFKATEPAAPAGVHAAECPALPWVVEQGRPVVIQDISSDPLCERCQGCFRAQGARSGIILPLRSEGASLGVLSIFSADTAAFDEDEVTLLAEMGEDLAYGIRAMRNQVAREESACRIQATMKDTIQALASTVEFRDPYTAGHQRRVAQLAREIGRELGLGEDRIDGLYLASVVHDIGKIRVPAEVLTRPGKLSKGEFEIVKTHVEAGYDILKSIDFPWPIASVVRQHHERMNGSGYPLGVGGEELLLESRILAVADVVEAIASFRPYRPALGFDFAIAEIEAGRGTVFDSEVVDHCIRLIKEKHFAFE